MIARENGVLSWAPYARDGRIHEAYFSTDRYFTSFPPGSFVLDVGCGEGEELQALLDRACQGIGLELDDAALGVARARGLRIVKAPAEALPLATGSVDGIIFKGVLPFTEEDQAFAELARVLRPGGRLEAEYLGPGFGLRDLLLGVNFRKRFFGLRSLVNFVLMSVVGRKLPGWLGDTVFITPARLARFYARHGFTLLSHTPSPTFLGLPVFIYHSLERSRN